MAADSSREGRVTKMKIPELKPCPFCGGDAEADRQRSYAAIYGGHSGREVAIYCLVCPADMSICCEDVPEAPPEALYDELCILWNTRKQTTGE